MYYKFLRAAIPALTGLAAIFLFSCNHKQVSLAYTNAKGEVPQLENLVFRFDRSIHSDSLSGGWDSTEYVRFEPAITGRFRWNGPDELVFSPSQPLFPATTYKAVFQEPLLEASAYDGVTQDELRFHTASLQLEDARINWAADAGSTPVPLVTLAFNYPVSPKDISDKIELTSDDARLPIDILSSKPSKNIRFRLGNVRAMDRSYAIRMVLRKGIKPVKANQETKEDLVSDLTLSSPYRLSINDVKAEQDGGAGTVHIYTSQSVSRLGITSLIHLEPAVAFAIHYDEDGLQLTSDAFQPDQTYRLTIDKGLKGEAGGTLSEGYEGSFGFGELEPDIRFTNSKAVYLSRRGAGNIEAKMTGVKKVKLVISRIYENNLLMTQRTGYYPYNSNDEEGEYTQPEGVGGIAGDIIYSKEIETKSLPKSAGGRILNIAQFEDRLPEIRGIYHVQIQSADESWVSDSRFISYSDIGMIARQGTDKMVVFANSIKTTKALQGVQMRLYGANNQLLGSASTNSDGAAEIPMQARSAEGFKPAMIIASNGKDLSYLPLSSTKVNTTRFEVGGKRNNPSGLDAFIYGEREIYRPGEQVNFSVILRDGQWNVPENLPVKMRFLLPNGKELKTFRKTLNAQGGTDGSVPIPETSLTGSYTLQVYTSNDVLLGTKNFMVEEFMPDRIKLAADLAQKTLKPGTDAQLHISAMNFFGPPAANRKYETELQVRQKEFSAKAFSDYNFNLANERSFFDHETQEGVTDNAGNAEARFRIPEFYTNSGLLEANFFTTVFDETGRPVSKSSKVDIVTQDVFNGIREDDAYYYALNQPAVFQLISLNGQGNPVRAVTRIQIMKHEYRTTLARSGDYFRYESEPEDRMLSDQQIEVGVKTSITYVPRTPGEYEIRVSRPGATAYVSKSFYSYGSWGSDNSNFQVNTEGHVDISADKAVYATGDNARLLFKTPFSGRLLVTIEKNKLLSYHYLDVPNRTATMDIKMNDDFLPNVYVTATLIKPHDVTDLPLTVAHGFQSLRVEASSRRIPVMITASANTRSHTKQTVKVKAAPGSFVSLAAVDNGVMQITQATHPDPYAFFYQKQALEVFGYDMYPLLFPELRARLSSTGGDLNELVVSRTNPMPAKRVKILSYWSGLKQTNSAGEAEFSYDVPQFSGQVRLMAVAFKGKTFGSAEFTTTVADPVVLSTALPRFMSPGDTVQVPVTITNTLGSAFNGTIQLETTGGVKVAGSSQRSISMSGGKETRADFQIVAAPAMDLAKVKVVVRSGKDQYEDLTELSVRPASTLQKRSGGGSLVSGQTQRISLPVSDFIGNGTSYQLVVGRSMLVELSDKIRYLVQYPYGCTEQVVSSVFPQLYYADLAGVVGNNKKASIAENMREAMRKISMRQLSSGALTLWDGEGEAHWWATAYAAHFLVEARKAGYDVESSLLDPMLSYLTSRLRSGETVMYYYNRNQKKKIAPKEIAYSLYVLALAGKPQAGTMNYYKANSQLLALDSRYLISAAYAIGGDKRAFAAFLPGTFNGEESVQQTGGSFYSPLRDEALALNALLEADPGNAQIPSLSTQVSAHFKTERYPNTQECSFTLLALGKMARASAASSITAEIRRGDKLIGTASTTWRGDKAILGGSEVIISAKGSGRMYYSWLAEGISATGAFKAEDHFVRARRKYFDRNGNPIAGNTFKQNQLIIVELTLEKAYDGTIENVVLTDLLPAGFEIENPRTKEIPGMDWIKHSSEPNALDVRDDRIHFFVDVYAPVQRYYYAVRAVSPGVFRQGPVSADAMYNGDIHSYNGAGWIRVITQ